MQPLTERVTLLLQRFDGPAVPLPELVRLLRENGVAVSEPVLLRSLAAEPEHFRVLEPGRCLRTSPARAELPWAQWSWVVPPGGGKTRRAGQRDPWTLWRLETGLMQLGWQLDLDSVTDLARWFGMVLEAERLRALLSPDGCRDAPAAVSSAAAAASANPHLRPPPRATARAPWRAPGGRPSRPRATRSG